jgi:hypothetical protein
VEFAEKEMEKTEIYWHEIISDNGDKAFDEDRFIRCLKSQLSKKKTLSEEITDLEREGRGKGEKR